MEFLPSHYVYGYCRCYVWPLGVYGWGKPSTGHCGRCGELPRALNEMIGPEEALMIYYENYGCYPVPMDESDYWFKKYLPQ